ncbi:MAG TPA: hypothetical protein VKR53_11580, partial [Puia sp.]|nr:hypothetical protein [Puia sp.]
MKFLTCLIASLFFLSSILWAQPNKLINSGEIIERGSKLYDSGKYKQALLLYTQINRNDTNYVKALFARALSSEADSQYDMTIKYCKEALSLNYQREYEPELYNTYGNTLIDMHRYEEAVKIFDVGLSKYPSYSFLTFNKGIAYLNWDSVAKAEQLFQNTLLINPYLYSAHYQLGITALKQGKLVEAFLSFVAYLIMYPDGKYERKSISILSEISNGVDDILEIKNKRTIEPAENYQSVEDIVLSKIALDKAYKPIINLDDPISRQIQVVFEKLEYNEESADFWMQYYIPFFKDIYNSGKFELFINHAFSNINVAQIQDYNKKKKKELQSFVDDAAIYFNLIRSTRELFYKKRNSVTERYFFEKGDLVGKGGTLNNGKTIIGLWHFYYPAGNIKSVGEFNNTGEKEGNWTFYYYSGKIEANENYKNGKLQGEQKNYFKNEALSEDDSYTNGLLDGIDNTYYY